MRKSFVLLVSLGLWGQLGFSAPSSGNLLKLHNSQYYSSSTPFFREGAKGENSGIAIEVKNEFRFRKSLSFYAHLENDFSASENANYLKPFEFYLHQKVDSKVDVYLGRRVETWTEWETLWRQGVFQPRYLQSKLDPELAGLAGVFMGSGSASSRFTIGALVAHVPDINAKSWIEKDRFVSYNPWFNPPASRFNWGGQGGEIRYSLQEPEVGDVLANAGAMAKWESVTSFSTTRLTAGYKPMSQFLLGFPSRGLVISSSGDYMKIDIQPRILYHQVLSADQSFQLGPWRAGASVTYDQPESETGLEEQTRQQVSPALILAGQLSRPLEAEGPQATRINVGFLRIAGGSAGDLGDFAGAKTKFEPRFQYSEAYLLGLVKYWRGFSRYPVESEGRLVLDRQQNGAALSLAARMNLARHWRAGLEFDALGLLGEEAEVKDGFFSRYRSNDRVAVEMSYAF